MTDAPVPRFVLGALRAVRTSGPIDMADFDTACLIAGFFGYPRAMAWLRAHQDRYPDMLRALEHALAAHQPLPTGYWTNGRDTWTGADVENGVVPSNAWWVEPQDE
jgi:hypothetical protein